MAEKIIKTKIVCKSKGWRTQVRRLKAAARKLGTASN